MKQILFIAIALAETSMLGQKINAWAKDGATTVHYSSLQDEKTKIKKEELPEAVRKKINGDAFKGWITVTAYKLTNGEFEVELKKSDLTQVLKFDKDGNTK